MLTEEEKVKEISPLVIGYKFALGIIELVLGLGIGFFGEEVLDAFNGLQGASFFDDPNDLLANILQGILPYITVHKVAVSVILILLGLVKIISCIAIWYGKEWGVHLLLLLMLVLLPFDLYGLIRNLSIGSVVLNVINIWIIYSITDNHPIKYIKSWEQSYFRKGA
jgi:uncharacterized membrane protein